MDKLKLTSQTQEWNSKLVIEEVENHYNLPARIFTRLRNRQCQVLLQLGTNKAIKNKKDWLQAIRNQIPRCFSPASQSLGDSIYHPRQKSGGLFSREEKIKGLWSWGGQS